MTSAFQSPHGAAGMASTGSMVAALRDLLRGAPVAARRAPHAAPPGDRAGDTTREGFAGTVHAATPWPAGSVRLRVDVEDAAWLSAASCYAAAMQQLVTREPGAIDVARSCAQTLHHLAVVRDDPPRPSAEALDAAPALAPAPSYDWYSLRRL